MGEIWSFRKRLSWWGIENYFPFMGIFIKQSFYPGTLQANQFCKYINVFQSTVIVAVWKCWIFYFWIFSVPYNDFCIFLSWLIIACATVLISDRWAISEIFKDLKTKTFPSIIKFLIRQILRTLSVFAIWLWKSFHVLVFYCRRNVNQVFSQFFSLD